MFQHVFQHIPPQILNMNIYSRIQTAQKKHIETTKQ